MNKTQPLSLLSFWLLEAFQPLITVQIPQCVTQRTERARHSGIGLQPQSLGGGLRGQQFKVILRSTESSRSAWVT